MGEVSNVIRFRKATDENQRPSSRYASQTNHDLNDHFYLSSGEAEYQFMKKNLPTGASIVIFGLGEGVCLGELSEAGFVITAIDRDEAKVSSARVKVPGAFVLAADIRDVVVPSEIDGIIIPSGVLADHSHGFASAMLMRASSFLRDGGLIASSVSVLVRHDAPGWGGIRDAELSIRRAALAAGLEVSGIAREPSAKSSDKCRVILLARKKVARDPSPTWKKLDPSQNPIEDNIKDAKKINIVDGMSSSLSSQKNSQEKEGEG